MRGPPRRDGAGGQRGDHGRGRPPPQQARDLIARGLLTLALVGLVVWLLLSNVGELSGVIDALEQVSAADAVLLVALLLLSQVLIGAQLATTVPGLGLTRGVVAVESASASSNVDPGPSGTATRLAVLRSWGFYTDDFARSWIFTSSLTNLTVLVMPAVAVVLAAIENDIPARVLALALVGLVACVIGAVVVVRVVASERFARRVGALWGRVGPLGRRGRPPPPQHPRLRGRDPPLPRRPAQQLALGVRVTLAVVATYATTGVIFGLSLRATGLEREAVSIGAIAVVYTIVRLLTIVNFTPGGVGVTEALYTSALLTVTGGDYESQIVAGVFLFRGLTYVGAILLGAVALLVWRFRRSWRVHPPPEPVGAAGVGAVIADREPPG